MGETKLKVKYLGTGAAEGIPAIFCHCAICNQARLLGGRNIRTRAQALIDNELLIDFGPDTFLHMLKYNIKLADIEYCLITHNHDDHLYVPDLKARKRSRAILKPGTPPLNVYGSIGIKNTVCPDENGFITKNKSVRFILLNAYEQKKIGKFSVTALPAVHGGDSPFVYVIQKGKSTFLYAHDTDYFMDEVWKFIEGSKFQFDAISLDCTEGKKHINYTGHMNFEKMEFFCKKLQSIGSINANTLVIANHISHNGLVNYDEGCEIANKYGVVVAFDGMEVEF